MEEGKKGKGEEWMIKFSNFESAPKSAFIATKSQRHKVLFL